MNFSLHLQTIFTFVRQNKANSQEKKTHPYTYTRIVLDICLFALELNCGSVLAERCTENTVHAHIHIYRYQGP